MEDQSNDEISAGIGKRLRAARDASGMSRNLVAEKLGRSLQALKSWEGGETSPSAVDLCRLADLYGASTDWIVGRPQPGRFIGLIDRLSERRGMTHAGSTECMYALSTLGVEITDDIEVITDRADWERRVRTVQGKLLELLEKENGKR